ncbi:DUF960 family protein [Virgibacillus sp. L01]|uniref:DUF960 family protein n=1 Tax=Virgibacillus sp. L01 TaxID=3457429 RepID=UPI003FD058C7
MNIRDDVIKLLKEKFEVTVDGEKLGEEALLLYLDEIDKDIVSTEVNKLLPNPVVFQTYVYKEESEWIIGIAFKEGTDYPLYLVCLKDGKKVYEKIYSQGVSKEEEQPKSRYMTKAINEALNLELQMNLWKLMDLLATKRKEKMDYFQAFDINVYNKGLRVTNKQELPYMREEFINISGKINTKTMTVWIIDDTDKQTMLFPSDC